MSEKKNATQFKRFASTESDVHKYVAGNAVDRNITTCMRAEDIGATALVHTMWWKVDLGEVYTIYSVDILFKNYHGYGIDFHLLHYHTKMH